LPRAALGLGFGDFRFQSGFDDCQVFFCCQVGCFQFGFDLGQFAFCCHVGIGLNITDRFGDSFGFGFLDSGLFQALHKLQRVSLLSLLTKCLP
jgi:hypothetical protein